MSDLMDSYWRLPPVARTLATAVLGTSLAVYTGLVPFRLLLFHTDLLFKMPPEVWRLATSFLLTGPQLSILLDPYFLYSYVAQLEVGNPRFPRREDLLWYLTFVSTVTIAVDHLVGLRAGSYLQGLILALTYTATQDQRGVKARFYVITIPAQLIPCAMLLVTFIMAGPRAALNMFCGLPAAHLYDFLTRIWPEFGGGANLLPTPAFFSRLVAATTGRRSPAAPPAAAAAGRPLGGTVTGRSTGSSTGSGPLPDAWRTRGRGQRLGGD